LGHPYSSILIKPLAHFHYTQSLCILPHKTITTCSHFPLSSSTQPVRTSTYRRQRFFLSSLFLGYKSHDEEETGMRKWWWFCVLVQWRDGYGFGWIKVVDGEGESRGIWG